MGIIINDDSNVQIPLCVWFLKNTKNYQASLHYLRSTITY